MTEASAALTPRGDIDLSEGKAQRMAYAEEAEAIGSIPPPATLKGMIKTGIAKVSGRSSATLMDKIGERIAFERGGTRLYDALLTKFEAVSQNNGDVLPPMDELVSDGEEGLPPEYLGESAEQTLRRIRSEEVMHFWLLSAAMKKLGGDPTAQTPCADVTATATAGLLQVVTDPRTTLAQCLNAMQTAELTDNAGWELLIQLADDAGEVDLVAQFLGALGEEQAHLIAVKNWLTYLVTEKSETEAV
ncbi:MAG TPA: ferritin-like domain-containing protein [Burkholderiaceae bacterium]|nr:ferritin-like domain-containing protein [Burkholderiaceae bacterium]